jgi:hypothetical protein
MANSASLRDLADRFLEIRDSVRAGGASPYLWNAAEALARRGASEIANGDAPDLLGVWFEECRKAGYPYREEDRKAGCPDRVSGQSNDVSSEDKLAQSIYDGYLNDMCEASAAFCKRLEAKVLQAEFEERLAQNGHPHVSQPPVELTGAADEVLATQGKASQSRSQRDPGSTPAEKSDGRECSEADRPPSDDESAQAPSLAQLASPEERALVPNHLTGSAVEQFLEELLATKALIKAEAEKIWNGCSNAHRMISVAANDEKRRVFSEQYERWRDQLIELQETLIVGRLLPLVAKYQIFANEQKWLLQACHEVWRPVSAGYLDWLTFAVRGHVHGIGTGAIPEWAWQLRGGPRDVARLDLTPEKKASAHFRGLVDTLQRDLALYREGAIAKAFLMRNTNESPIVDSGMDTKWESRLDQQGRETAPNREGGRGSLLSKYRSGLKRGILIQLTKNPRATDVEICRALDADGSIDLPESWKGRKDDRSFVDAYLSASLKRRVEVAISKVRADLRKEGLLAPR